MINTAMFDTIRHTTSITSPKTVEVKEHRAPTDESIRLADEFTEKAWSRVIKAFHLQGNILNATAIVTSEPWTDSTFLRFEFSLNGKTYNGSVLLPERRFRKPDAWGRLVIESIQAEITKELSRVITQTLVEYAERPLVDLARGR